MNCKLGWTDSAPLGLLNKRCNIEDLDWSNVVQEVLEAYYTAQSAVGLIKPAELERKLKSRDWKFIQPLSVGDDLSIVLKLDFKQPDADELKDLSRSMQMALGSIKSFKHVLISENGGYLGIGNGMLRISTKFPKEALLEILKILLS